MPDIASLNYSGFNRFFIFESIDQPPLLYMKRYARSRYMAKSLRYSSAIIQKPLQKFYSELYNN
jgi:hypothetical protein